MNKIRLFLLFIIVMPFFSYAYEEKAVFIGSIQFPSILEVIPGVRIYYAGKKISTEIDEDGHRIIFSVPAPKNLTFFYFLITPEIQFSSNENTIEFLKLKPRMPYRFYVVELVTTEESGNKRAKSTMAFAENTTKYHWNIKEVTLNLPANRIPDDTIIICFDPSYIQKLEGGNAVEFPKICLRPDLLKLTGSEKKLHELSTSWFLAALNTDTIHEAPAPEIKFSPHSKTVIALTA